MESLPTVLVDISGGNGEIRCQPTTHVPSAILLTHIIDKCKIGLLCWNLFVTVPANEKLSFEQRGWTLAGIASNAFGLGNHGLRMKFFIGKSRDGQAAGAQLRTTQHIQREVEQGLPGWRISA